MIYFRADSNSHIASGHIMRCLSLAQYFRTHGHKVAFLIADKNPINILKNSNIPYVVLDSAWNDLSQEVAKVQAILSKEDNPLLIIDTYSVTKEYVSQLKPYSKICYLGSKKTDLGALNAIINYSSDIDYGFYQSTYDSDSVALLLGVKYAPLREEFNSIANHFNSVLRRVLVTTGNTDSMDFTSAFLRRIVGTEKFADLDFDVVIGSMFDKRDNLISEFENCNNIHLHTNVASISELMKKSDVAISANGTSVYELAASKVAILSFAMVAEQLESAKGLNKLGVVCFCGELYNDFNGCLENIVENLQRYKDDSKARQNLITQASNQIDGKGCGYILNELMRFELL
ncbi:UDP-2,4-diacetamido-2,4,6-trideoxy-beta-L-altropyranose hydrolase [Bacteroides uniformis]|uniref:UDP-2,4-diacetamido-2,4, 6-trideoxy-beta-L-altropyranose hydrolase n=1 Tax=Bacteroides uniformis TaxID=820 RepID=UPI00189A4CCC|nr:UDP-2,4-diacetamido-2,4,6-trideoxy-beta-L-altropyranose hydrolase [Bacteroides uniformis]